MPEEDKIVIESITSPGRTERVNKAKYLVMKDALLKVLPDAAPGITVAQAREDLLPHLPEDLFPGGGTAGWWLKAVQLDLEAKRIIARAAGSPVRLFSLAETD